MTVKRLKDKYQWHTRMGEYNLEDGERVLIGYEDGFMLARYDAKKDRWEGDDGKFYVGGLAFLPLPSVEEMMKISGDGIKDKPYYNMWKDDYIKKERL